jgi:hypothetical protein
MSDALDAIDDLLSELSPLPDVTHVQDMIAYGDWSGIARDQAPWVDAARWYPDRQGVPPTLRWADAKDPDGQPYGTAPDQAETSDAARSSQPAVTRAYLRNNTPRPDDELCASQAGPYPFRVAPVPPEAFPFPVTRSSPFEPVTSSTDALREIERLLVEPYGVEELGMRIGRILSGASRDDLLIGLGYPALRSIVRDVSRMRSADSIDPRCRPDRPRWLG